MRIFQHSRSKLRHQSALTLVEMMVATTLLVVIMLGLTAMFNQTQRAFRGGLKQVDVFEGGRAVMDMITRDIEQLTPSKTIDNWSLYAGIPALTYLKQRPISGTGDDLRTNVLQSVYLLNYSSQWAALGYRVLNPDDINTFNNLTYGSLYRFSTNFSELPFQTNYYFQLFTDTPSNLTNGYLTRVADGIVHFKLNFYDAAGTLIPAYDSAGEVTNMNITSPAVMIGNEISPTVLPGERLIGFSDTALPAMVEVELGILEPQTLKQARSLPDIGPAPTPRQAYLEKQGGKVHIFRQQIPIRNAPR